MFLRISQYSKKPGDRYLVHEIVIISMLLVPFFRKLEGLKISCIEEVAYNMNYINFENLKEIVNNMPGSSYKNYLETFIDIKSK